MRGSKINYEYMVAALNKYAEDVDYYDYHDQYNTSEDGFNDLHNSLHDPKFRQQIIKQIETDIKEVISDDPDLIKDAKAILKMLKDYHNANNNPLKKAKLSYKMPKQAGLNKMSRGI